MAKLSSVKTVPWLILFEAARTTQHHVTEVTSTADRRKVRDILVRTKGLPHHLTAADKRDLKRIAGKIDLKALGGELTPTLLRSRSHKR